MIITDTKTIYNNFTSILQNDNIFQVYDCKINKKTGKKGKNMVKLVELN